MKAVVIGAALLIVSGAVVRGAQDPLNAARDLYASAASEDALSTLNKLEGELPPEVDRQANEYRAFCLYALNRTSEADSIVEAIIRQAPLTPLTATDASPDSNSASSRSEAVAAIAHPRAVPLGTGGARSSSWPPPSRISSRRDS